MGDGKDKEDISFYALILGEIQITKAIWNLGVGFRGELGADRKFVILSIRVTIEILIIN